MLYSEQGLKTQRDDGDGAKGRSKQVIDENAKDQKGQLFWNHKKWVSKPGSTKWHQHSEGESINGHKIYKEMPSKIPAFAPFFFHATIKPRRLSIFGPKTQFPKLSWIIPVIEKQEPRVPDSAHTLYICPFLAHVTPRCAPCLRTFWEGETLRLTLVRPPGKEKWSLSFTSTLVRRNPLFFFFCCQDSDFFSNLVPIRHYNQVVPAGGWFWVLSER